MVFANSTAMGHAESPGLHRDYAGSWRDLLVSRLHGPGGLYNLGNTFGLCTGLALHMLSATGGGTAFWTYFIGDPAALALTVSMIIFFVSGEIYHQAYGATSALQRRRLQQADRWSGHAALLLGTGLLILRDPLLACSSGVLHALGKYGSAGFVPSGSWSKISRWIVVISRFPALLATGLAMACAVKGAAILSITVLSSAAMLVCYALWLIADIMLIRTSPPRH